MTKQYRDILTSNSISIEDQNDDYKFELYKEEYLDDSFNTFISILQDIIKISSSYASNFNPYSETLLNIHKNLFNKVSEFLRLDLRKLLIGIDYSNPDKFKKWVEPFINIILQSYIVSSARAIDKYNKRNITDMDDIMRFNSHSNNDSINKNYSRLCTLIEDYLDTHPELY